VVADAVCAPTQRELGQIPGAKYDCVMLIGKPEQRGGARSSLHILEGDIVSLLAARKWVVDIRQHLTAMICHIDLHRGDAERIHQPPSVAFGPFACGESRQCTVLNQALQTPQ
jgi:hypothetical protein